MTTGRADMGEAGLGQGVRVIGAIPARWGSTRLPGKCLTLLNGKPLIQWTVERARRAVTLDTLLVATDDRRIADAVEAVGATAVLTDPSHPSGTDRIAEAVRDIPGDVVINIQGDEPLIDPRLIDRLASAMVTDESWDMATAAVPFAPDEDVADSSMVKVVRAEDGAALYFSRSVIPCVRDRDGFDAGRLYWRHIGLYGYRRGFLERLVRRRPCLLEQAEKLEQLRALYMGGRILVLEAEEAAIGVDTPADVAYVERLLRTGSQQ